MTAKKTAKKVAPKKTVTKRPFEEIEEEVEEGTQEVNAFEKASRAATLSAVSGINVDETIKKLTEVNLSLGRTLSDVQQQVIEKVGELNQINEAINLKTDELQTIYDKETVLQETAELVQLHKKTSAAFDEQQAEWERNFTEHRNTAELLRVRSDEEYKFNLTVKRRNDQTTYEENARQRDLNNKIKQDELERSWATREREISAQEAEFKNLQAQVEQFPAKLDAEVKKAEAIVANSVKRDLTHTFELAKKDLETQLHISRQENASKEVRLEQNAAELDRLRLQLSEANQKIVDVANGAFASVSGQAALGALQNFGNGAAQTKSNPKS